MKIGLVRHFKVQIELPVKAFITRDELSAFLVEYDKADIEYGQVDLGDVSWKRCYASSHQRAMKTARSIYPGEITILQGLSEPNPMLLFSRNYKLPFLLWPVLVRIKQWIFTDYKKEISSCLNEILSKSDEDTLIVSHDFTMRFLKKELTKRGFRGVDFKHPANGKLYIFENSY